MSTGERLLFGSFFLAGFECTSARLADGRRLNLTRAARHDVYLDEDYERLKALGICGVREGISWPEAAGTCPYQFDWLRRMLEAVQRHKLSLILDLCHFGFPDHVDPFTPAFADAFCDYAGAVAQVVSTESSDRVTFIPINEPSYFAWAGGEVGMFAPFSVGRGTELKRALIAAAIGGINAIRQMCPEARIVNTDPLCRVVAGGSEGDEESARRFNSESVYQAWDMIAGRLSPELGGSRDHLGIVGVNYYPWNQWELGAPFIDVLHQVRQPLAEDDPRRCSVETLIADLVDRYGVPVLISETSCSDPNRSEWLMEIAAAARRLLDEGKPLGGICIYPALSMPLWLAPERWLHMGLWDVDPTTTDFERGPAHHAIAAVRWAQSKLDLV